MIDVALAPAPRLGADPTVCQIQRLSNLQNYRRFTLPEEENQFPSDEIMFLIRPTRPVVRINGGHDAASDRDRDKREIEQTLTVEYYRRIVQRVLRRGFDDREVLAALRSRNIIWAVDRLNQLARANTLDGKNPNADHAVILLLQLREFRETVLESVT